MDSDQELSTDGEETRTWAVESVGGAVGGAVGGVVVPATTSASVVPPVAVSVAPSVAAPVAPPAKITIRFQAIGGAPPIHPKVFKIAAAQTFGVLQRFLHKRLQRQGSDDSQLFLYLHNSFLPASDEQLASLHAAFLVNDELVVSYCLTVAFG